MSLVARSNSIKCRDNFLAKQLIANDIARRDIDALSRTPYRVGEMAIIVPAWNDVPMNMRRHVAKTCQIHLVRLVKLAYCFFNRKDNTHHVLPFSIRNIRHFTFMTIENHPAESGIVRIGNADNATKRILPDQFTARRAT